MSTVMLNSGTLTIPPTVRDLASFREWVYSPDFPEKLHAWWLRKDVWVDMSQEQIFSHASLKGLFFRKLSDLVESVDSGVVMNDGVLLTNEYADLSGNPDLFYVSHDSREARRCVLIAGKERGFTEVQGSPDMVLEVVSDGSEEKDLDLLRDVYFRSDIAEYWLVDGRESSFSFEILRAGEKEYRPVRKQSGWVKSAVFKKSFRLSETANKLGDPKYLLEVR